MQYIRDIEKMVLSMIQPDPLPGSYRHDTAGIQEIVDMHFGRRRWLQKIILMESLYRI